MHLGIEKHTGTIFEGLNGPELPAQPPPVLSFCHILAAGASTWPVLPTSIGAASGAWVFREDLFDAVTRTRRGRVYQPYGGTQPDSVTVARQTGPDTLSTGYTPSTHRRLEMYRFTAASSLVVQPHRCLGQTMLVGAGSALSAWRIVQAEVTVNGDVMLTLKSLSAFGIVPQLEMDRVPQQGQAVVRQAVDRLIDSAFRETPVSVVDQCRNAMTVVIGQYLVSQGEDLRVAHKDLAQVAEHLHRRDRKIAAWTANIVARLHVRGKGNEQQRLESRIVTEDDAEFALHALGLLLRELGLAH